MKPSNENLVGNPTERSPDSSDPPIRDNIFQGATNVQITKEDPRELESRLRKEEEEAKIERLKDIGFSIVLVIVSIALTLFCCYLILSPHISQDDKNHAWQLITLVAGAYLGYFSGKATK